MATHIHLGDAMEDIFVVKRCNKIIVQGRRAGEVTHPPVIAEVWFRIADSRTHGGFIGDGYEREEDARRECQRLNSISSKVSRQG